MSALRIAAENPEGEIADGELLARFAADRDEAAFAALVARRRFAPIGRFTGN